MSIPGGEVAKSTVEALKGNPSCLAAIVLAGLFALLTYMSLRESQAQYHERFTMLMRDCFDKSGVPGDANH